MSARRTWRRTWHRLCRNERSGCDQPDAHCFLHMDAYQAIGIALASDVLASAVSAYTYGKNKNLDIKNGLVMMFTVMIFTFIASYLASFIPSTTMGGFSTFMTMLLGIKFIVKPVMTTKETMAATDPKNGSSNPSSAELSSDASAALSVPEAE